MNADQFIGALGKWMDWHKPKGYGAEWTSGMTKVFRGMARSSGMALRCRGQGGEIGRVDYSFVKCSKMFSRFPRVEVAIEHENVWSTSAAIQDFHKLCTVAAPLRVMFCYRCDKAQARQTCNELMSLYSAAKYYSLPESETLVLAGWDQGGARRFRWHSFLYRDSDSVWEEL